MKSVVQGKLKNDVYLNQYNWLLTPTIERWPSQLHVALLLDILVGMVLRFDTVELLLLVAMIQCIRRE